jgi:hypothetical protein
MIFQHLVIICANVPISLHSWEGKFYIKLSYVCYMNFIIACNYKTHRNKISSKDIFLNMKRKNCVFLRVSRIYYFWFVIIGIYVGLIIFSIKYITICIFSNSNNGHWAVGVADSNLILYFKVNYLFKESDDYVEKSYLIQITLHNFSKYLPVKHVCLWKKILSWMASLEEVEILAKGFSCVPGGGGEFIGFPSE